MTNRSHMEFDSSKRARSRSNSAEAHASSQSCFIKLSNCNASEEDIRSFFKGFEIDSVEPLTQSSVSLVKFSDYKVAASALTYDQKELNGNQV